jgi:hypothetical protein
VSFAAAVSYAAGGNPNSVTSSDLDGDGDLDLAVANSRSREISVLLNQGDGTFAEAVSYATGWSPISVTSSDLDGDGVPDNVENAGPNGRDGNLDGVPDAQQANVASLPHPDSGIYVTLVADETIQLENVSFANNLWPDQTPGGIDFVLDFLSFTLTGVQPHEVVTLEMIVHADLALNAFYRCGPTPAYNYDHWYPFLFNGDTGAEMTADGRIVVHLVDGGRGDSNPVADGKIVSFAAPVLDNRPYPWQNPHVPFDVNGDYWVTPLDALLIINDLNLNLSRPLPFPATPANLPLHYLDVTGNNNHVEPLDALLVINDLNLNGAREVPPAHLGQAVAQMTPLIAGGESEAALLPGLLSLAYVDRADVSRFLGYDELANVGWSRADRLPVESSGPSEDPSPWSPMASEKSRSANPFFASGPWASSAETDDIWLQDLFADELETAIAAIAGAIGRA